MRINGDFVVEALKPDGSWKIGEVHPARATGRQNFDEADASVTLYRLMKAAEVAGAESRSSTRKSPAKPMGFATERIFRSPLIP